MMMNARAMALMLLGPLVVGGCQKPAGTAAPAPLPGLPTKAQPKLPTTKLWLGAEELVAELALTGEQQQTGMMFRTNMAENAGMLFVFPVPFRASFWMMNTILPLSAAYIDPDVIILEIYVLQ